MAAEALPPNQSRWRTPVAIACLVAALLCLGYPLRWLEGLETRLIDLRFSLRGERDPSGRVVVIAIDNASLQRHPELPTDPGLNAMLINRLSQAGAAAIALDLPELTVRTTDAAEPRDEPSPFEQLTAAVAASRRVILPMVMTEVGEDGPRAIPAPVKRFSAGPGELLRPPQLEHAQLSYPRPDACAAAAGIGALNVYPDRDWTVRSMPLLVSVGDELYPSLALESVRVASGEPAGSYSLDGSDAVVFGKRRAPVDAAGEMLINYAGPDGTYPTYSYADFVVEGGLTEGLREAVKGRVVLVGATATVLPSRLRTPFSLYMPGVEANANAVETLLTKRFLVRARMRDALLLTLAGALAALLLAVNLPAARAAVSALTVLLTVGALSVGLFAVGVCLPTAGPLLAISIVGGILIARQAAAEYMTRKQETDRVMSRVGALAGVGRVLNSGLNREQLLTEIMRWVEAEVGCEAGSMVRLEEDGETLFFEVALGPKGDEIKQLRMKAGEGIVGTVVASGRPLLVPDTSADPRFAHDIARAVGFPAHSIACVPMSVRGSVIGAIEVINKRDGSAFTSQDVELLTVISQHAAMFLETARLYRVLEERVDFANRELRIANQELSVEKAKIEAILEHMADGVIAADGAGRIVLGNRVAAEMLGQPYEALEGTPANSLPVRALAGLLTGEDGPEAVRELTLGSPERIVRAQVAVAEDEQGVAGRVVVLTDITELRELDRMKTDMVSFVSHELKNPIGSIKGFAGLIRDRSQEAAHRESADFISRTAERMYRLIDDFLNITRLDAGRELEMHWEWVGDVRPLVDDVVESESRDRPDHTFAVSVALGLPRFRADPGKLRQILVNLLSNAVKYSPDGGPIIITAHPGPDSTVRFAVSDEGVGISPENMQHLFGRFRRVGGSGSDRIEGTGLGLFLTRHLVLAHGGDIHGESILGEGSTFTFTLPLEGKPDDEHDSEDQPG